MTGDAYETDPAAAGPTAHSADDRVHHARLRVVIILPLWIASGLAGGDRWVDGRDIHVGPREFFGDARPDCFHVRQFAGGESRCVAVVGIGGRVARKIEEVIAPIA